MSNLRALPWRGSTADKPTPKRKRPEPPMVDYTIEKNMPAVEVGTGRTMNGERKALEKLEVGDGFWITDEDAMKRARWARSKMKPRKFTVIYVAGRQAWQVRRIK